MTILTKNGMTTAELRSFAEKLSRSAASKKGRRTYKRARRPEDALQASVARYLNILEGQGHLLWFHVPNGGKRHILEAVKMKRMGVKAGVPDLVIIPKAGPVCFIELKAEDGDTTELQEFWIKSLPDYGCPCEVCRSLDEVRAFLYRAGVVRECVA